MSIQTQLHAQPNPNPNNKAVHQFETVNMPAYSLTPVPCNDIRLWSGKVVEPLIIEDVPSSMHEEGMNPQCLSNAETLIIEDTENTTNMPAETQKDTFIDTQPTQLIRETQKRHIYRHTSYKIV